MHKVVVFGGCTGLTVKLTQALLSSNPDAWNGFSGKTIILDANSIAVTGKMATVKAKKVKKKAQKIGVAKLYTFTDPGTAKPKRSFQSLILAAVSRHTNTSRSSTRPLSSSSGMNNPGLIMPSSG